MTLRQIRSELEYLRGNTKGQLFLIAFRISASLTRSRTRRFWGAPIRYLYKIIIQWGLGIDVPDQVRIGTGVKLYHGQGLVVHELAVIGDRVCLHHNTTIGTAHEKGPTPVVGNDVIVGAHSVILGGITIGDGSVIAAGSVVIRDVRPFTLVAGNPAREMKRLDSEAKIA